MTELDSVPVNLIEQADNYSPWTKTLIKDCINREHYYNWVLFLEQQLIGYCLTTAQVNEAQLLAIAIHPEYRGYGYGEQLLSYAMTKLAALANKVLLEVRTTNQAAIKLYEKMGFEKIGERKNYYRQGNGCRDALVYEKKLCCYFKHAECSCSKIK